MNGVEMAANNNIVDAAMARKDSIVDETKKSCWNCCRRNKKMVENEMEQMEQAATAAVQSATETVEKERGKCGMCLRRVFCCKRTPRIEDLADLDVEAQQGCCRCWPCRRKPKADMAWAEARAEHLTGEPPKA